VINCTLGIAMPTWSLQTAAEPDAVVANTNDLGFPITTDAMRLLRPRAAGPVSVGVADPTYPDWARLVGSSTLTAPR
jgi:hypothetical protein